MQQFDLISKKLPFFVISFFVCLINCFSQTTTINYASSSLSTSACNVFASNPLVGGVSNSARAGGVSFTSGTGIYLATSPAATSPGGTAYIINYTFTAGDKYSIAITTSGGDGSVNLHTSVVPNLTQFPTNGTTSCSPDNDAWNYSLAGYGDQTFPLIPSSSQINNVSQFTMGSTNYSYLVIWASGGNSSLSLDGFYISSVTITQTVTTCSLTAPTGLAVTNSGTTLNWNVVTGASSYKIAVTDTHSGTPMTSNLTSSTNSIHYCASGNSDNISFTVQSVCSSGIGGGTSSSYSFTPTVLSSPIGVTFNSNSQTNALTWNAVTGATTYSIQIKDMTLGGTTVSFLTGFNSNSASYGSLYLVGGHTFEAEISGSNSCYGGPWCSWYEFAVPVPCNPPTVNAVSAIGGGKLQITYSAPISGQTVTNYNIDLYEYSPTVSTTLYSNVGTTGSATIAVPTQGGTYLASMQSVCGTNASTFTAQCCSSPVWAYNSTPLSTNKKIATEDSTENYNSNIGPSIFSIYPIPASSQINVLYKTGQAGKVDILIVNQLGAVIIRKELIANTGPNSFTLNVGQLANGVYVVKATDKKSSYTQKIVIQK